ncbi:MAG: hypothetical protein AAFY11_12410 [Cyanobacteria bacterium J06641_5]
MGDSSATNCDRHHCSKLDLAGHLTQAQAKIKIPCAPIASLESDLP